MRRAQHRKTSMATDVCLDALHLLVAESFSDMAWLLRHAGWWQVVPGGYLAL
jgi:hypothetical protein